MIICPSRTLLFRCANDVAQLVEFLHHGNSQIRQAGMRALSSYCLPNGLAIVS